MMRRTNACRCMEINKTIATKFSAPDRWRAGWDGGRVGKGAANVGGVLVLMRKENVCASGVFGA